MCVISYAHNSKEIVSPIGEIPGLHQSRCPVQTDLLPPTLDPNEGVWIIKVCNEPWRMTTCNENHINKVSVGEL